MAAWRQGARGAPRHFGPCRRALQAPAAPARSFTTVSFSVMAMAATCLRAPSRRPCLGAQARPSGHRRLPYPCTLPGSRSSTLGCRRCGVPVVVAGLVVCPLSCAKGSSLGFPQLCSPSTRFPRLGVSCPITSPHPSHALTAHLILLQMYSYGAPYGPQPPGWQVGASFASGGAAATTSASARAVAVASHGRSRSSSAWSPSWGLGLPGYYPLPLPAHHWTGSGVCAHGAGPRAPLRCQLLRGLVGAIPSTTHD
jgi:hypothetical protein